ncbi:hypothetical protein Esti_001020 [Eimeria stiedai]
MRGRHPLESEGVRKRVQEDGHLPLWACAVAIVEIAVAVEAAERKADVEELAWSHSVLHLSWSERGAPSWEPGLCLGQQALAYCARERRCNSLSSYTPPLCFPPLAKTLKEEGVSRELPSPIRRTKASLCFRCARSTGEARERARESSERQSEKEAPRVPPETRATDSTLALRPERSSSRSCSS